AFYHTSCEKLNKIECLIQELYMVLVIAEVCYVSTVNVIPKHGMSKDCMLSSYTKKFVLGARKIAGDADVEVYSVASLLVAAMERRIAGDTVAYHSPNCRDIKVELVSVTSYKN